VDPIEWCRLGNYQDVSMRLIAERLLEPALRGKTVLQGELSFERPTLPMPSAVNRYHLCHSPHNRGVAAMVDELRCALSLQVEVTERLEEVGESERFLLYLTTETWTQSAESEALARDVERAMDAGTRLLLVHECPGIDMDVSTERGALPFDEVILKTPHHLVARGIYDFIAIALKAGAWRQAGLVFLALDLAGYKQDLRRRFLMKYMHLPGGCGGCGTGVAGLLARLRQGRRTLKAEEVGGNDTLLMSRGGRIVERLQGPSVQLSGQPFGARALGLTVQSGPEGS